MEGKMISSIADALYKIYIYMHSWRVLVRWRDIALLDEMRDGVR
jgi:hypothetical protein